MQHSKIITIIGAFAVTFLPACAHKAAMTKTAASNNAGTEISVNSVDAKLKNDPDGDRDTKGYVYFPISRSATGKTVFVFDPNFNAWALYDKDGKRVNTGKASGGQAYCPDVGRPCRTVTGVFRIYSKGGADCASNLYPIETNGGAPMPYCMHFHGGYAIHGSNEIPNYNASHGCIRITPGAAKWLNVNHLDIGSTVIVLPYKD